MAAPACAAPLLAQARDRAGEADRDRRSRAARCRCRARARSSRDSEQLAGDEPLLDLAPLRGRVAGPVRRERATASPSRSAVNLWISSAARRLLAKQSVRRPRETRSAISLDASPSALARRPSSSSSERRVPERDRPLGPRRRVVADHGDVEPESARARELAGVRDRRRGEQELRLGAVDAREPAQPPEDVRRRASRTRRGRRAPRRRRRSARFESTSPQRSWWGRTPTWSMSGLVRMRFAHLRICQRRSPRVSPS